MKKRTITWTWENPEAQELFVELIKFPDDSQSFHEVDQMESLLDLRPPMRVLDLSGWTEFCSHFALGGILHVGGGQGKMRQVRLVGRARQTLERIAHSAANARMVRRAQALLWLHGGERVDVVAHRLGMSRRGIYKIVAQYQARAGEPVADRIADRPHSGRRATKRNQVARLVARLLKTKPSRYGYRALVWSTPMLRHQVERQLHLSVSERTVRRALRQLRYRYKRPRYVLARRSGTWRQAKGGSKTA